MTTEHARIVLALQTLAIAYRIDGQLEVAKHYEAQALARLRATPRVILTTEHTDGAA